MKNWLLALFSILALSGCATVSEQMPKVSAQTNIPFFFSSVIKVYNSAGQGVVIVPQSRGDGFVAEYRYGKRMWQYLWLKREQIPTKLVALSFGESITLPLYRNTSQYSVTIPFAVKVLEHGQVVGFYNYCVSVPPYQNASFDFNFGRRELEALKSGNTGSQCNGYGW